MKQEIAQRIQEEKEVKAMSNLNFFSILNLRIL